MLGWVGQGPISDSSVTVAQLAAADLDVVGYAAGQQDAEPTHKKDLVVIEDVQLLSAGGVEPLVQLIDRRLAQRRPTLLTSRLSPQALGQEFPARLTSRLASGLELQSGNVSDVK